MNKKRSRNSNSVLTDLNLHILRRRTSESNELNYMRVIRKEIPSTNKRSASQHFGKKNTDNIYMKSPTKRKVTFNTSITEEKSFEVNHNNPLVNYSAYMKAVKMVTNTTL